MSDARLIKALEDWIDWYEPSRRLWQRTIDLLAEAAGSKDPLNNNSDHARREAEILKKLEEIKNELRKRK